MSWTMIIVDYTSHPNTSGFICLRTTHVIHFDYHWWSSLKLLDLFYQNLFNNIDGIIIKALICLHCIFFFFFAPFALFFFYCKLYQSICSIWESSRWYLWIARVNIFCTNIIYDSLICAIFLNNFYTMSFYLVFFKY